MTVISLSDCPQKVRGDLSKWLLEISTGVFVGNINYRVREELWERICENVKEGRVAMVYNSSGEQGMDFRVHNTKWIPVDYDGIKLIQHPNIENLKDEDFSENGFSKAAKILKADRMQEFHLKKQVTDIYVVIDLETTGLNAKTDKIIEIAALLVKNGKPCNEFSKFVKIDGNVPTKIQEFTGISDDLLQSEGETLEIVLKEFLTFIGKNKLVGHNIRFDISFLKAANIPISYTEIVDTCSLARRNIYDVADYQLETLVSHFKIDATGNHRALRDCYLTHKLYEKLKKKIKSRYLAASASYWWSIGDSNP